MGRLPLGVLLPTWLKLCRNQQTTRLLDNCVLENLHKLARSVERIENRVCGEPRARESNPTSEDGVIKFSVSSKALTKQMSVSDVAVAFFVDNCQTGFELDKRSDLSNEMVQPERKKLWNFFGTIKRAVKILLFHCDSFPLTLTRNP